MKFRNRKAGKVAGVRLKKANKLLKIQDITGFYDELEQALWGYLADKLNIPFSDLSKDKVNEEFIRQQIPSEISEDFFRIVDSCQLARYAPGEIKSEMTEIYRRAVQIINKLDQNL
jgi:hypothetical protein